MNSIFDIIGPVMIAHLVRIPLVQHGLARWLVVYLGIRRRRLK